jgi:hypothetical protein
MRHPSLRSLTVSVAVAAVLLVTGVTAQAKPLVNFTDTGTFAGEVDCGDDFVLQTQGTFREHVLINARGKSRLPHFQVNVSFTTVITNPDTGKTFTIIGSFLDQDQSVIDNGDGTFTVIIKFVGSRRNLGPDGKLLFIDAGQELLETQWAGDGEFPSDGTRLSEELLKLVGRHDTADRNFCADMREFLT